MMNKCKIVIPQSTRSDFGHSDPIIKQFQNDPDFEVIILKLVPSSYRGAYAVAKNCCMIEKPDVFLAIGDRIEAAGAVAGAFHNEDRPFIVHYGSGTVNGLIATIDDKSRHCIMIYSDLQLCEDHGSLIRTRDTLTALNLKPNCFEVGLTLHEGLEVRDYSLVPRNPFDLILYNPPTMYHEDILSLLDLDENKLILWVESNGDPTSLDYFKIVHKKYKNVVFVNNQPRPQFLGLLEKCDNYISNSSNIFTEAPFLIPEENILPIGDRNRLRSTSIMRTEKASQKIYKIIKEWWNNENRVNIV